MPLNSLFRTLLLALFLVPCAVIASDAEIQLHDIIGTPTIKVTRGKAEVSVAKGGKLQPNDKFTTLEKQNVRLVFPDGSQLWVGGASSVLVNSSGSEVQLAYIYHGKVRVQVPKSQESVKKIKFVLRSKAVVMGVRGTDFVVDTDTAGKYQLHTLNGEVEAAGSDEKLISGGVLVGRGKFISGQENQPIPTPAPFDVKRYEAQLLKDQPGFATLQQTPVVFEPPRVLSVPAATGAAPANTGVNGIREKINTINQQHNQAIEDKVGF